MPLAVLDAVHLLQELICGYQQPDFQQKMAEIYYEHGDNEEMPALLRARRELTMTVQQHVLPKYGFEATYAGVHRSWVEYQKPPLMYDGEIAQCNLLIEYLIRLNPKARARDRKADEEREAKRKHLMDKRTLVLSVLDGMHLLDELITGYQDPDFQHAQMLINKLFADEEDRREFIRAQRAICMTVQSLVLPKFGFEATQVGVHKSYMAFQVSELDENVEIRRRNSLVGYLIHECPYERAQEVLSRSHLQHEEEEPPVGRRRRGAPLAPGSARGAAAGDVPRPSAAPPISPSCTVHLAIMELLGPKAPPADEGQREDGEAECEAAADSVARAALEGSPWEGVSLGKFFPPPAGTAPLHLLSADGGDDGLGAPEEGLGCPISFHIRPVARLLLEALEDQCSLGRVLELGTGTGVVGLSLACRGAVAEGSLLVDVDSRCVRLAAANALLAGVRGVSVATLDVGARPDGGFDTVVASDLLRDEALPGRPLAAPDQPSKLLDMVEAALRGPEGGHLVLGYQHRHPALTDAFLSEAARRGAIVREVLTDWAPDAGATGQLARLSIYLLEYRGFWQLPGGALAVQQLEIPSAVWEQPNGMVQHQVSSYTRFNRHPEIFSALKELLTSTRKETWELRILSFGCSDGSECRTMRMYFPQAAIDGLDIDSELIRKNRESNNDRDIKYYDSLGHLQEGSYDAVLMMTVLCRYGDANEDRLPFEVFDQTLAVMDRYLRLNGLFVIYNANYLFSSSSIAHRYDNLALAGGVSFESGFVTKYNRTGRKISCEGVDYPWVFFKKRSTAGAGTTTAAARTEEGDGMEAGKRLLGEWLCENHDDPFSFRIDMAEGVCLHIAMWMATWQGSAELRSQDPWWSFVLNGAEGFFAMRLRFEKANEVIVFNWKFSDTDEWSPDMLAYRATSAVQAAANVASALVQVPAAELAGADNTHGSTTESVEAQEAGATLDAAVGIGARTAEDGAAGNGATAAKAARLSASACAAEGTIAVNGGTSANIDPLDVSICASGEGHAGVNDKAADPLGSAAAPEPPTEAGQEAATAGSDTDAAWKALLTRLQVYALAIPSRRDHVRNLLHKWGFTGAVVVDGILKDSIDLADWEAMGRIKVSKASKTEHGTVINTGRVACHFGHRRILRSFLDGEPIKKELALIFEDDLLDQPRELVQQATLSFFAEVPPVFDILHLGYLWEDEELRQRVGDSNVYRTCKAVGRHAYVVTKQTASLLLTETYPQSEAGDQMNIKVIQRHHLRAYQPSAPIFCQDREVFPISELTGHYRAARNFRPPREQMKKWNSASRQSRTTAKLRERHRKDQLAEEARRELERKRREEPLALDAPWNEPLPVALRHSYQLSGTWDDWKGLVALQRESKVSTWFTAEVPIGKGKDIEFQVLSDRKWQQRYYPAPDGREGILGPYNGGHGQNWKILAPEHPSLMHVRWNPTGSRMLTFTMKDRLP